jgi:purine-binding chemotaxis protein CheW
MRILVRQRIVHSGSAIEIMNTNHSTSRAIDHSLEASQVLTEFISFAVGDVQYGVDVVAVREIKEWSKVTRLPDQPDYMRGVLNLRGIMVPVVDLRCRFGQGVTEVNPAHIVMVVHIGDRQVGLLADRVLDIVSVDAGKIQPVPKVDRSARDDLLSGLVSIEGVLIALVDLDNLLPAAVVQDASCRPPVAAATAKQQSWKN